MALTINHNIAALNANKKQDDTRPDPAHRLASGLRVNTPADAAAMSIREMMATDAAAMSAKIARLLDVAAMLQTAEGGLSLIDACLMRMRELAEQSATGSYSAEQRQMIEEEFQAMIGEVNRTASACEYGGKRLLDGGLSAARKKSASPGEDEVERFLRDLNIPDAGIPSGTMTAATPEAAAIAQEAVGRLAENNARVRNHLGAMLDRLGALLATFKQAAEAAERAGEATREGDGAGASHVLELLR